MPEDRQRRVSNRLKPGRLLRMFDLQRLSGPTLYDETHGVAVQLGDRVRIGRSRHNTIRLLDASVSGEHALLEWRDDHWELRDLGSRNGSRVDGQAVPAGGTLVVGLGSTLEFAQEERVWVLLDARDPTDHQERPVDHTVLTATVDKPLGLHEAVFHFQVSRDEETAFWSVQLGNRTHDLGSRAHVYLAVTLARLRLAEQHLPEAERGWTYGDELAHRLGMTPETLKVQVYRVRRQLQGLLVGAAQVIERRAATNQIRFGADRIVLGDTEPDQ